MVSNGSIAPSDRIDGLVDDAFELVADLQQMQWHADVNLALATVEAVARLRQTANQLLDLVANEASAQGASWAAIGERAGMSRQAARQRWNGEVQASYESPVALGGKRERPWED